MEVRNKKRRRKEGKEGMTRREKERMTRREKEKRWKKGRDDKKREGKKPVQRPQTVRGNKHYPQGSSHQRSSQGQRRPPRGQFHNNTARVTEERPTSERLTQIRCSLCHRKDHSEEHCPKHLSCEYCQGRFHTERTCRERQADRRHQDLIQAVRLGSQETLAVLLGAAWRLPSQQLNNTWGTRPTPGVGLYNSHYPYPQANVRGFHTNVGELTHRFVQANKADIVFVCETFLDNNVTSGYARIKGYSSWVRKDRSTLGGGVALCFKNSLRVVVLDTPILQIWKSGSSIDPVVTDLPSHEIQCSSMGPVGSSDHEAILTKITFKRPRDESITRTLWQWESADWCQLRNSLEQTDWESVLQGDVDQQVEQFTETLLSVQNRWVSHKQHRTKATDQPWFGPQCCTASNDKYRAWRRYKRHPTRHNRTLLRAATARLVTTQAWAREQWEECLRKKWYYSPLDKRHFARKMAVPDPTRAPPSLPVVAGGKLTSFSLSEAEVRASLSALEEVKAVGPDGVSPRVLRRCSKELTSPLTKLFRAILHHNQWPRLWKTSHVVPVHKKGSRSEVTNYQPVSLLSVISKVLEGIITQRLTTHLEEQYLLSERQFGFRKGRSAADLNLLLVNEWSDARDQGRPTAVLALDIVGAFDRVWHPALVERLYAAGLSGGALKLLRHYLLERHLKVVHNGLQSPPCNIEAGVPQGSVLGPLLWNIYVNDLLNLVPSAKAYADDVTVSVSFAPGDETSTISHLNTILHRLEIWGRRWQVSFAPHKTHLIVVSRTRHDIRLFFDGAFLAPSKELKILGVTYDDKLTFKLHIMQLARTTAGQLASLRRISWLLDNRRRELLYKAQIRSTLEYSCLAWGGAAPSHIAVLDKVQRRAERIIWDGQQRQPGALQCLQHRRDVAGLTTFFKAQVRRTPHLNQLRQAERRTEVFTRTVAAEPGALALHRSHSTHHQRQFTQVYTRLWNYLLASDSCPNHLTNNTVGLQRFKVLVHRWLSSVRDSDTED
ncbi:hypothetical protein Pmani_009587 [Petrolisthes manimaculis]|uniref:Reverse transcriptase domain-containing protein n=1 Tax=Petrolisthes manimaculis TaxID=1843537 RepID=A0AAE1Q4N4_9EUCA|nr:hypothetical protein Pmani_009587 [Petrolisthes manimaculis]